MVEIFGVVLAALLLVSFAALFLYFIVAVGVSALTVRRAQRDRRLTNELDQVLVEILGPRTGPATMPGARSARPDRSL
jgi:membrane protein implicated in regulation of membrane protease activity